MEEGKTDNPFQFCWKQFLQMDLNFSENTSEGLYCSEGKYLSARQAMIYFLQLLCARNSVEMIEV